MTTTAAPPTSPTPPLRANRDFRLLWIGQALSDFGSSMVFIALPMVLLSGGYSTSAVGTIGTAMLITALVARMPGGYLTDRYNHRALMLTADLARFVVFAVVTLWTFLGELPLELAVGAVVVAQLGAELFKPSQSAIVRLVVPREQLPTAISLNQARGYAAEIAAPAAAGVLVAVSLGLPFAVDTFAFAASAVCVYLLSPVARASRAGAPVSADERRAAKAAGTREPFLRSLTAGLRYVARSRFLRTVALLATGLNFLFQALVYALILGLAQGGGGSGAVGAALSVAAVTGLVGSVVAPFLQRRLRIQVLVAAGPAFAGILLAVAWWTGSEIAFAASLAGMSLLTPVVGAALGVVLVTLVPREIFGRTTSAIGFVSESLQPFGPLAAGLMLAALPLSAVSAVFACGFLVIAVLALFLPSPPPPVTP
ncbi:MULTISPECIES: MFS transporter [unclassified Streptomyces]|uniref:MFS transporter n=1 Tax=unclassified Streptomyces TaxID=2593676 RepID=UPI0015E1635B|nr:MULTISPECIES: MFS transporter [unclassified Streptomyces]